jgi:glycosyltransferase involved in cell wall biosynthesis
MRIIIAHNFYQQAGGEDQCVAAEIAMLRAYGHEVTQYALHNDQIDAMSRLAVGLRTIWSHPTFRELRALFRQHRPQIVHFHNTFPLLSPAAYYAARLESVVVVQTLHNFRLICANALFFRDDKVCEACLGKTLPWPGVMGKCYRGSRSASATVSAMQVVHRALGTWSRAVDAYIALTQFSAGKLAAGGVPAHKIEVKPNFVYPDPGTGRGMGGYAIFVGRFSAEKGLTTLLEAWRHLDGILPLKIVGDGPLAGAVQDEAARNPAIQWVGRQPLGAVYDMIGEAMFLVSPSRCYENFPRAIAEAFAKGTPVLASRLGAMAEIVDDCRTGLLFNPGDAQDLAIRVRQMLRHKSELARMRCSARGEFADKFTAEANYRRLMAIYERALGSSETQPKRSRSVSVGPRC